MSSSFQLNGAAAFMITAAQWLTFQNCDINGESRETGDIILSTFAFPVYILITVIQKSYFYYCDGENGGDILFLLC